MYVCSDAGAVGSGAGADDAGAVDAYDLYACV